MAMLQIAHIKLVKVGLANFTLNWSSGKENAHRLLKLSNFMPANYNMSLLLLLLQQITLLANLLL